MLKYFNLPNISVLALGTVTALAVSLLLESRAADQPLTPWPRIVNGKRAFPNIELLNQLGEKVRFYDDLVKDQSVFLYFIYSRCEGT